MSSVIWFRRDLRVLDNPALSAAAEASDGQLRCLYVVDKKLVASSSPAKKHYLASTLRELDKSLGGRLNVLRTSDPIDAVATFACGDPVFVASGFTPFGIRRDNDAVKRGVDLRHIGSPYLVAPGTVINASGQPYRVFTPFARQWRSQPWYSPTSVKLNVDLIAEPVSRDFPDVGQRCFDGPIGERESLRRLEQFVEQSLGAYTTDRDLPAVDGTSMLSAALRWGSIHPRTIAASVLRSGSDAGEKFLTEIAWREFYADVLFHNPSSVTQDLTNALQHMAYDEGALADQRFEAWCAGQTGYPIVDAGMRQLVNTGWMHNRVRMIVASFLVKDLHLWWGRGARFFMDHLVDGDIASNQHGWQWCAGTGTDAAPYFRIFNPTTQAKKFDPDGEYVMRWVPELSGLAPKYVHEPWKAEHRLDYPKPIVDHAIERLEALRRYGLAKQQS